ALAAALDAALARGAWEELRLALECSRDGRLEAVDLFTNGVGIWESSRQFRLARGEVLALLAAFRRAGFAELRDSYGGAGDPEPTTPSPTPAAARPELLCRLRLALDGADKQVVQLAGGRQSPALARLAREIVGLCAGPAGEGIGAATLAEGLERLAGGELAPEVLFLQATRRDGEAVEAPGWLLAVEGAVATTRAYAPGAGYGPERRRALAPEEVAALAGLLAAERVHELPVNLWADGYTDLEVAVLGRRTSLQARRFARMDAAAQAAPRERFARLLDALERLGRRVAAEGGLSRPGRS
ncbi:MAG TPA: hypothetical protein VF121_02130, partial [Thermoanaerobaculia bacterium]|nr:hypothetical protein [Thermoanaerobaculia bacterium]